MRVGAYREGLGRAHDRRIGGIRRRGEIGVDNGAASRQGCPSDRDVVGRWLGRDRTQFLCQ